MSPEINTIRYRYQYDANNNLVAVQDIVTGQTTTREVDEYNRLKKETQATGFIFEYAYDRAGRQTRVLMPGSNAVDYVYNAAFMTRRSAHDQHRNPGRNRQPCLATQLYQQ